MGGAAVRVLAVAPVGLAIGSRVALVGVTAPGGVDEIIVVAAGRSDEKQPNPQASRDHPATLLRSSGRGNQGNRPSA